MCDALSSRFPAQLSQDTFLCKKYLLVFKRGVTQLALLHPPKGRRNPSGKNGLVV
jgi:hypothetical protein